MQNNIVFSYNVPKKIYIIIIKYYFIFMYIGKYSLSLFLNIYIKIFPFISLNNISKKKRISRERKKEKKGENIIH